ncbi:hypothetical protein EV356DRAFT_308689 [Viridothelium virens]|uniref:Uncharacterized protein n=1 Tax=Viridothelium virens TaxID=1048519 RepID=A0A6A6HLK2_VIRVR|nr:hypothetical protein EV356DRAFT_308689 [Viridothelium virens]
MPATEKSSRGRSNSRKAKQPRAKPRPTSQARIQGASGQSLKSASKKKRPETSPTAVLPGPRRHTRTSKGSPLVKPRDDINKLTGKSKQKLEVSSPVVEPTTPAESVLETHHIYQEAVIPHPFAQPLPNIEEALEAAFEGQQDLPETHVPSSHDFHGEESTSVHDPTDSTDSDVASWLGGQSDAENTFLQRNGYTVPLSNEALAAIRVVLVNLARRSQCTA